MNHFCRARSSTFSHPISKPCSLLCLKRLTTEIFLCQAKNIRLSAAGSPASRRYILCLDQPRKCRQRVLPRESCAVRHRRAWRGENSGGGTEVGAEACSSPRKRPSPKLGLPSARSKQRSSQYTSPKVHKTKPRRIATSNLRCRHSVIKKKPTRYVRTYRRQAQGGDSVEVASRVHRPNGLVCWRCFMSLGYGRAMWRPDLTKIGHT